MIGFWVAAAILTACIVGLLGAPLMRNRSNARASGGTDLAVYRDQLNELARDRARGLVEADQAEALEAEIGRRMLAAAKTAGTATIEVGPPARRLTFALMALVPLAALALYLVVGHPDLPGQPLAERTIAPDSDPAKILAAVDRVKSGLKPTKDDLDRWIMIAEAYGKLGKPQDSVAAFRVAVSIAPDDPALGAALAESLVQAGNGNVDDEAKHLFAAVPVESPAHPEAAFYLAAAAAQAGDWRTALDGWKALLANAPADAPYVGAVRERIAVAARSLGLDPAKETPEPRPAATAPGPSAADVQAAQQMSPDQRMAMIRSMVAGLAAKLEANPDDADGWRRLARAYQVLGEDDKAKAALAKAQAADAKASAKP